MRAHCAERADVRNGTYDVRWTGLIRDFTLPRFLLTFQAAILQQKDDKQLDTQQGAEYQQQAKWFLKGRYR